MTLYRGVSLETKKRLGTKTTSDISDQKKLVQLVLLLIKHVSSTSFYIEPSI